MSRNEGEANEHLAEYARRTKRAAIPAFKRIKQPRDFRVAIAFVESLRRIVTAVAIVAVVLMCIAAAFALPRFDASKLPAQKQAAQPLIV